MCWVIVSQVVQLQPQGKLSRALLVHAGSQ